MKKICRGDIYRVCLDPVQGREQQGTRPIFVVSSDRFNAVTQTQVVLPISNGAGFARDNGFAVTLMGAGLETTGVVRCDQPRTLDLAARNGKFCEKVPDFIIQEVLDKVEALFEH